MALERRRPLPAGRYWLDVWEDHRSAWEIWKTAMSHAGRAKVTHTESFDAIGGNKAHDFVIFETDQETIGWPEELGSPNVAGPEIQSSNDTLDRPEPMPEVIDQIAASTGSIVSTGKTIFVVGVGVAVVAALVSIFRRR